MPFGILQILVQNFQIARLRCSKVDIFWNFELKARMLYAFSSLLQSNLYIASLEGPASDGHYMEGDPIQRVAMKRFHCCGFKICFAMHFVQGSEFFSEFFSKDRYFWGCFSFSFRVERSTRNPVTRNPVARYFSRILQRIERLMLFEAQSFIFLGF
jgi:hypothetical protein